MSSNATIVERMVRHGDPLVERLVKRGLVRREADTTDRRSTLVAITAEGRALAERASQAVGAANFGLPALDAEKRDRLVDLLLEIRLLSGDLEEEHARVARRVRNNSG